MIEFILCLFAKIFLDTFSFFRFALCKVIFRNHWYGKTEASEIYYVDEVTTGSWQGEYTEKAHYEYAIVRKCRICGDKHIEYKNADEIYKFVNNL